ncbi:hypothetical protein [Methylicorpusculum sp.]|uniref:hypothetical protein n=1 Tax=Methylicorpusculum sp. TaxID=2713644 RepID=UPI00271ED7F5|nr:hypothetical protein [Methylicorpusculum sp.]MDO8844483.1 hypothetical protein [Methylicorpusculum sp.]
MDGVGLSPPCDLGSGNPCRNDGVDVGSTTNVDSALQSGEPYGMIEVKGDAGADLKTIVINNSIR